MTFDPLLVRRSFDLVRARERELGRRVCDTLLLRHPALRSLLGETGRAQGERAVECFLTALADHADDRRALARELRLLDDRVAPISRELGPFAEEAVLATLAAVAGDEWSPSVHVAWSHAYTLALGLLVEPTSDEEI